MFSTRTAALIAVLMISQAALAQEDRNTTPQPPAFIETCKHTYESLEIRFKLIHDHILVELGTLSKKLASSEQEQVVAADLKVRDLIAKGKRPEFKTYRADASRLVDAYYKSPAFTAQRERLKRDGLDLYVTFYQGQLPGEREDPSIWIHLQDSGNSIAADYPISAPDKIITSYWDAPSLQASEQTLRKLGSECRPYIGKNQKTEAAAQSSKVEPKPATAPAGGEDTAGSSGQNKSSGAK